MTFWRKLCESCKNDIAKKLFLSIEYTLMMSSSKRLFSVVSPHGPGGVFFSWQRTSGGYLATTGYDQVKKTMRSFKKKWKNRHSICASMDSSYCLETALWKKSESWKFNTTKLIMLQKKVHVDLNFLSFFVIKSYFSFFLINQNLFTSMHPPFITWTLWQMGSKLTLCTFRISQYSSNWQWKCVWKVWPKLHKNQEFRKEKSRCIYHLTKIKCYKLH